MASIKEEGTRGKRLSYKFRVCLGRDENGMQISKAMRWNPPEDMTPAKAKKEAQRVAAVWEAEQKEVFERQKAQQEGRKTDYTFGQFVDEVWVPLCVRDGSHRPSTIAMYTNILKVMRPHFEELLLNEISGIQITQYLTWLRNDYRTQYGNPLAEKSIKHHYNWLQMAVRGIATLSFVALTYGLSIWLRNTTNLLFLGLCLLALPLVWNQTLCLFTHGGLLTGSKTLLWLGSSGWNPMAPVALVLGYTLPVILLAERRHQRGL